jgi:hypothetical protein
MPSLPCLDVSRCIEDVETSQIRAHDQMVTLGAAVPVSESIKKNTESGPTKITGPHFLK